jgi:ribonucleoside-diphosphate reductase alpha chain
VADTLNKLETVNLSAYAELSRERKAAQAAGDLPEWVTTGGYQMLKEKYFYKGATLRETFERIADTAALHLPKHLQSVYAHRFFLLMWRGWLALSTPVLSNMGTPKGMPVSCSGQYIEDSIDGFYKGYHELAMLTKHGFGTSSNLSDIRPRGTPISSGGKASGVMDVITSCVEDMRKVAQGTSRRGAWAGYLDIEHGDFWEVIEYLERFPDDLNIGWILTNEFKSKLDSGDAEAIRRWERALKVRAVTGKGYHIYIDDVNDYRPYCYKDRGIKISASNLCTEIFLPSDADHTFTCVLSSMNLAMYDEWKDTTAVQDSIVFLDCVASEFIKLAKGKSGFDKAVSFTEKSRALGLGALGFHTYLQQNMMPFGSFQAHMKNNEIFSHIKNEALVATRFLAELLGEPEWCKGNGTRNSHLLAIAPNTSSALICGGTSQGIEPWVANVYNQQTSAGELYRINPIFMKLAKERGRFNNNLVSDILDKKGSVQHLDWLTQLEKDVFKTAYEINQKDILRLAATRQPHICQGQSLNVFFDADEDEGYISEVHQEAYNNPNILALYYMRTLPGVQASKGECVACEG